MEGVGTGLVNINAAFVGSVWGLILFSILQLDPTVGVADSSLRSWCCTYRLLTPCQTIHIINPFLSQFPPYYTHTHKHTALTLLCSPFPGDLNKLLENCIQQSPGNPHSTTNTPFLLPYTPVPLRALFPTEFFQSNTQVNTHAHRNFFPLLNCGGEQRSSGWSGLCYLFAKLTLKCWPGRMWWGMVCVFVCM